MKYELSMDRFGRRYWLCTYDDGVEEALVSDAPLMFPCIEPTGSTAGYPLGSVLVFHVPSAAQATQTEAVAFLEVLTHAIRAEVKGDGDQDLDVERTRTRVMEIVRTVLERARKVPDRAALDRVIRERVRPLGSGAELAADPARIAAFNKQLEELAHREDSCFRPYPAPPEEEPTDDLPGKPANLQDQVPLEMRARDPGRFHG